MNVSAVLLPPASCPMYSWHTLPVIIFWKIAHDIKTLFRPFSTLTAVLMDAFCASSYLLPNWIYHQLKHNTSNPRPQNATSSTSKHSPLLSILIFSPYHIFLIESYVVFSTSGQAPDHTTSQQKQRKSLSIFWSTIHRPGTTTWRINEMTINFTYI